MKIAMLSQGGEKGSIELEILRKRLDAEGRRLNTSTNNQLTKFLSKNKQQARSGLIMSSLDKVMKNIGGEVLPTDDV